MGAGIAQVAAAAGHPVIIYDSRIEAVPKAIEEIRRNFEKLAAKGKLSAGVAESAAARLRGAASPQEFAKAGLVIEAIVEDLEAKRRLFAELEGIVDSGCLLATNTSSLSITAIAAGLKSPQRLVGMHFFNPVPLMELVEVIGGLATDSHALGVVHSTAAAWGKSPVFAKSTPGFIVNRVARPYYGEALLLLTEQAASPATIDAVMREAGGFRMGPFELMDLVGLDIGFAVSQSVFNAYFGDPRYRPAILQQEMVRAGFLGRKAGRGFYEYGPGAPAPQPRTEQASPRPKRAVLPQAGPLADALAHRLADSGVEVLRATNARQQWIEVGDAVLAVTDGRSAARRAFETERANLVLADLALDYGKATRLAIAKSPGCEESACLSVVGLLQAAGFAVSRMEDAPGLAVMRTVAMLANEGADAVHQGVATAADVDTAMRKGVNYPRGPMAWADSLGMETLHRVLSYLDAHYGGGRYRVSPRIGQLLWSRGRFHEGIAG